MDTPANKILILIFIFALSSCKPNEQNLKIQGSHIERPINIIAEEDAYTYISESDAVNSAPLTEPTTYPEIYDDSIFITTDGEFSLTGTYMKNLLEIIQYSLHNLHDEDSKSSYINHFYLCDYNFDNIPEILMTCYGPNLLGNYLYDLNNKSLILDFYEDNFILYQNRSGNKKFINNSIGKSGIDWWKDVIEEIYSDSSGLHIKTKFAMKPLMGYESVDKFYVVDKKGKFTPEMLDDCEVSEDEYNKAYEDYFAIYDEQIDYNKINIGNFPSIFAPDGNDYESLLTDKYVYDKIMAYFNVL